MSKPVRQTILEHLDGSERIHFAPSIPSRKLRSAAAAYSHQFEPGEDIIALYDDTVFGSAEQGFVLTDRRISWKNVLEAAQEISFTDLDAETLSTDPSTLFISGGQINISFGEDLPAKVRALLTELAGASQPPAPDQAERIRRLVLSHLGKHQALFYAPNIPPKKLQNANRIHALALAKIGPVLALYDDTVFGSAQEGFLITTRGVCWKDLMESPRFARWAELDAAQVVAAGNQITLAGSKMTITNQPELHAKIPLLFQEIAGLVQNPNASAAKPPGGAPAGAPPTGGVSAAAPAEGAAGFERCPYCNRRVPLDACISCPGCGAPL